jgi:plasmid stability protein
MPDLTIRDVPQPELDALLARAERHGRTLDEEARHVLHEAAAEQMLVMELERATQAVDAQLAKAAHAKGAQQSQATPSGSASPSKPRRAASGPRRRVKYEPTPGRG